jgi:hypothetical protein
MVALSSLGGGGGGSGGTPKVLFNGTLTSADLTGNDTFTLFTNDATTTVVIENIFVDATVGPFEINGDLVSGAFFNDTVNLGQTVNLAGSEITAPSTSLTVTLDTPVITKLADYYEDGFKNVMVTSGTVVKVSSLSDKLVLRDSNYPIAKTEQEIIVQNFDPTYDGVKVDLDTTLSVTNMTQSSWYYETGSHAYYFYNDGNSTLMLYHAPITDGTIGSWARFNTGTYAYKALDLGLNKVFFTKSGVFYEHDLATNVQTTILSSGMNSTSSNSVAASVNGVFFYIQSTSSSNYVSYYDTNDGTYGNFSLNSNFSLTTDPHLGACYNPEEDKYYITIGYQANTWIYAVTWGESKAGVYIGLQSAYPDGFGSTNCILGNTSGEMYLRSSSNSLQIIKFADNSMTIVEDLGSIGGSNISENIGAWYRMDSSVKQSIMLEASDYEINLKCKVSGTEYKEG